MGGIFESCFNCTRRGGNKVGEFLCVECFALAYAGNRAAFKVRAASHGAKGIPWKGSLWKDAMRIRA